MSYRAGAVYLAFLALSHSSSSSTTSAFSVGGNGKGFVVGSTTDCRSNCHPMMAGSSVAWRTTATSSVRRRPLCCGPHLLQAVGFTSNAGGGKSKMVRRLAASSSSSPASSPWEFPDGEFCDEVSSFLDSTKPGGNVRRGSYLTSSFSLSNHGRRTRRSREPQQVGGESGSVGMASKQAAAGERSKTRRLKSRTELNMMSNSMADMSAGASSCSPLEDVGRVTTTPRSRRRGKTSSISTSLTASAAAATEKNTEKRKTLATKRKTAAKNKKTNKSLSESTKARRRRTNRVSGEWYQRDEMLAHTLLSKEEEFELGEQIVKARNLREVIASLMEHRHHESENYAENDMPDYTGRRNEFENEEFARGGKESESELNDLEYLSIYGADIIHRNVFDTHNHHDGFREENENHNLSILTLSDINIDSHEHHRAGHRMQLPPRSDGQFDINYVRMLTDRDIQYIQNELGITARRAELQRILIDGVIARDELLRSNIRLVVSIAKQWMKKSWASVASSEEQVADLSSLYRGGWGRPSLDEAVQEGIIGLAKAVDNFDPSRGLKFSTYATYWVKNYVRLCFYAAATGCLRVPQQLHEIKAKYKALVRGYAETSNSYPSEEEMAAELGVTVHRLQTALRLTKSLKSIDAPIFPASASYKGSGAGGDLSGDNEICISDILQCTETKPEDHVELSFLRQCLENAMATELSPHERDVLRLRLGLDDGCTRTVKEVVEVCGGSVSTSDVMMAERRAFKKLRAPNSMHTHNLLSFFDFAGVDVNTLQRR